MKNGPDISLIASLIGDPARANMLLGLMDGGSLSAGELAEEAGLTLSTTSWHLSKLQAVGLIASRKDGRNKFFSIADARVAELIEQLMIVSNHLGHTRLRSSSKAGQLKQCRVCYDHLAGSKGVWLFKQLHAQKYIRGGIGQLNLTDEGHQFSQILGVDVETLERSNRALCEPCLDWSEDDYHLGGALGAAYLQRFIDLNWASRDRKGRGLVFSPKGEQGLQSLFPRQD